MKTSFKLKNVNKITPKLWRRLGIALTASGVSALPICKIFELEQYVWIGVLIMVVTFTGAFLTTFTAHEE